ncbi:hypothetical protein L3Q67_01120 [Saccharothrix sp. AJ9571]|nr:hypothetical protein L3Q67_01120 [Saccharothrix sp. AJ9571]
MTSTLPDSDRGLITGTLPLPVVGRHARPDDDSADRISMRLPVAKLQPGDVVHDNPRCAWQVELVRPVIPAHRSVHLFGRYVRGTRRGADLAGQPVIRPARSWRRVRVERPVSLEDTAVLPAVSVEDPAVLYVRAAGAVEVPEADRQQCKAHNCQGTGRWVIWPSAFCTPHAARLLAARAATFGGGA